METGWTRKDDIRTVKDDTKPGWVRRLGYRIVTKCVSQIIYFNVINVISDEDGVHLLIYDDEKGGLSRRTFAWDQFLDINIYESLEDDDEADELTQSEIEALFSRGDSE